MWADIARDISAATGERYTVRSHVRIGGGCINACYRVSDGGQSYFVKTNAVPGRATFTAEAAALAAIADTGTVRVPQPVCDGGDDTVAWLVLEYIELKPLSAGSAAALGAQLAALHTHTARQYGWDRDNTIGGTPQDNGWCADWVEFWRERRLRPQYMLARQQGYGGKLLRDGERLMERLDDLLSEHAPVAALLHGDLWSGNAACDPHGAPVVFDPASYYGHSEADLAMTELFGGYPAEFYAAYRASFPLGNGYRERSTLYNLYHVLNHLNLFGRAYLSQAERMTAELIALI